MSVQIQNEDYIFEYVSSFRTAQKQGLRTPFGHAKERGLHVCKRNCFFSRYPLRYSKKEEYTTEFAIFEVVVGRCRWF